MTKSNLDKTALMVFSLFAIAYLFIAYQVSQSPTRNAFDVVQGAHVFDVDDVYRFFLAQQPLQTTGIWFWNFILPVNVAFDGFFSQLSSHNAFFMRSSHLFVVLGSVFFVYRAGAHLGIAKSWALLSCSLLLLMPFFAFFSMSFYGESLMVAAMGLAIYALASRKEALFIIVVSIFPLIRPEGFFFLFAMLLKRAMERKWRSALFMATPGFLYFCLIMYFFDFSPVSFFSWRDALSSHYPLVPVDESVMGHALMPYYTINPLWWLVALAGACLPVMRLFRPFLYAAIVLALYWAWHCYVLVDARGEARYLMIALPLLVLSLAAAMDAIEKKLPGSGFRRRIGKGLCILLALFILVENFAQLDPLRARYFGDRRWPLAGERGAVPYFKLESAELRQWQEATARFLEVYPAYDRSIRRIIINAYPVFNDLDSTKLPEDVVVEFSPMTPEASYTYYGGYFYSMFPRFPQYTFYRLSPALNSPPNDGRNYALYVGGLYNGVHPPLFANPYFQVYKVNYEFRQDLPRHILLRADD